MVLRDAPEAEQERNVKEIRPWVPFFRCVHAIGTPGKGPSMNANFQEENKTNSLVESNGRPSTPIDWDKFPVSITEPSSLATVLWFLGRFTAKTLLALAAVIGIAVIGAMFARASSHGAVSCAVGGVIAALLLAAIALVVVNWERKTEDAEDRKKGTDG